MNLGEDVDIFRDTPVRYLGYANELGESFRSVIDVKWVWLSYGLASTYVVADTVSKSRKVWKETAGTGSQMSRTFTTGVDTLTWQAFASVIVPGFTINRICWATKKILRSTPLKRYAKWGSVITGLASIPLIIHPIDHAVDEVMDKTVRPLLGIEEKGKK